MQCSCGGVLADKAAVSKKLDLAFDYQECKACGRVANEMLFDYARIRFLARDIEARRLFEEYTGEAPLA
ncbi:TPA: hypothetical protein NPP60_004943 [Klebsiella variicola subsp. variicola]|nr:hypothetical protein [Klebsiella variicola subsp. variicola]